MKRKSTITTKERARRKAAVRAIVDRAGGERELAYRMDLAQASIRAWLDRGIPDQHWPAVARLAGLSLDDIYAASTGSWTTILTKMVEGTSPLLPRRD